MKRRGWGKGHRRGGGGEGSEHKMEKEKEKGAIYCIFVLTEGS